MNPTDLYGKAQELRSVIGNKFKDNFQTGDIIKFVAYKKYNYAVIKGDNNLWYSTAVRGDIPKTMNFKQLVDVLRSPDVESVQVATDYAFVV